MVVVEEVLPGEGVLLFMLDVELPPALVLLEVVDDKPAQWCSGIADGLRT